ncbi:type II toxin-antitoxin system PemK/MazF family toxin [Pedobacter cryophilus]|uniref:mRNA interferase n=1 Tax=Pedobacter cryophilus TaxID=2571271 RepID=A0A4U1C4Z4_9SPHI|nr:type II toxin-antitoxin system PemK/MazF family toxin [Pedobacter cryophilus]TKC00976.1 type II toxin-antitoxin system PemK/MazF family toxin [Pedobacter cryophilus]
MSNSLSIKRFELWIADLEPGNQSEPGKIRPVVVVQSDLINNLGHSSFLICPISSQQRTTQGRLRVSIKADEENGLGKDSYILSDQLRAIDINRFHEKIGELDEETIVKLVKGIKIMLDL